jgi:hypothetical protein
MDRPNDENQNQELSMEDVLAVASLAVVLTQQPYCRSDMSSGIKCFHPLTNVGCPDEDYLVLAKCGFEECEIWVYRGEVDVQATFERFRLFGVTTIRLAQLKAIYQEILTHV